MREKINSCSNKGMAATRPLKVALGLISFVASEGSKLIPRTKASPFAPVRALRCLSRTHSTPHHVGPWTNGYSVLLPPNSQRINTRVRSTSSSSSSSGSSPLSRGLPFLLADQGFQKLVREVIGIAGEVGVERGIQRGLLGARATLKFASEIASNPERTVEEDLKQPISDVFSKLDPEPVASASVAQVHKGILKATGEEVAVKIRKPGVDAALAADLGFILAAAKVVQYLNPDLEGVSLAGIVEDLREAMIGELDFRKEAENLRKFKNFLKSLDLTSALGYTSDPELTLINALNAWTLSVVANDFFHADVHAGNLLVLKDGRVAFIDFGIIGTIPPNIWDALQDLSKSLSTGDTRGVAAALVAMGATKQKVDVDKFGEDIDRILKNIDSIDRDMVISTDGRTAAAQIQVDQEEVTRMLLDIVQVAENNGVRLPREFGLLVKQALYFDRYTKLLAPKLNVMTDTRVQWSSDELSSSSLPPPSQRGGRNNRPDDDFIDVEPL
ncbi:hypothetical protein AAMO2058_000674800 [Amorphochlora amoebiformis]